MQEYIWIMNGYMRILHHRCEHKDYAWIKGNLLMEFLYQDYQLNELGLVME